MNKKNNIIYFDMKVQVLVEKFMHLTKGRIYDATKLHDNYFRVIRDNRSQGIYYFDKSCFKIISPVPVNKFNKGDILRSMFICHDLGLDSDKEYTVTKTNKDGLINLEDLPEPINPDLFELKSTQYEIF